MREVLKSTQNFRVVNSRLAQVLQNPRFGYQLESENGDGSAHLVKY